MHQSMPQTKAQRQANNGSRPYPHQPGMVHAPVSLPMVPAEQLQDWHHAAAGATAGTFDRRPVQQRIQMDQDAGAGSSKQPGRTTPQLLAKRAQRMRDAQALTHTIMAASTWRELEDVCHQQRASFNHIHLAAFMTRLAKLTSAPTHPTPTGQGASRTATARLKRDGPAIRVFLDSMVPYIGMHLLSLAPRQLATIMWALGSMGYTPQPAWVVEWSGCASRKLDAFTVQDLCMSAWGLTASGSTQLGSSAAAPGILMQLCQAAVQPRVLHMLQPRDVANLLWAVAASGVRPSANVLQALAAHTLQHLGQPRGDQVQAKPVQDRHAAVSLVQSSARQQAHEILREHSRVLTGVTKTAVLDGRPLQGRYASDRKDSSSDIQQAGSQYSDAAAVVSRDHMAVRQVSLASKHITQQRPRARFLPQELVTVTWSFAKLRYWPGETLLSCTLGTFCSLASAHNTETHGLTVFDGTSSNRSQPQHASGASPRVVSVEERSEALDMQGRSARARPAEQVASEQHHYGVMLWSLAKLRYRPPVASVMHLLHGCMAGSAGSSKANMKGMAALGNKATSVNAADLAQVAWALGALRFAPGGNCRQQLLKGIYRALVATAQHHGVPVADVSSQMAAVNLPQTGMLSSRQFRRARWHPLRRSNRAHGGKGLAGIESRRTDCHTLHNLPNATNLQQSPRFLGSAINTAATQPGAFTRHGSGSMQGMSTATVPSMPPAISTGTATSVSVDLDEADVLQVGELPVVLRGLHHISGSSTACPLPPQMVNAVYAAVCALSPELHKLSAPRILQLSAILARLHITPPTSFTQALVQYMSNIVSVLPVSQLAWLLVSLVWMRRPVPPRFLQHVMNRIVQLSTVEVPPASSVCINVDRTAVGTSAVRLNADGAALGQQSPEQLVQQTHVKWPGTPSELVMLLWALSRLRCAPLPGGWADALASCADSVAPALAPRQLARLVDAVRRLRLRPQACLSSSMSRSLAASAAIRAAAMRCDELCSVDDASSDAGGEGTPASHCRACSHLYSVPKLLRSWFRRLRLEQRGRWISVSRQVKQQPHLVVGSSTRCFRRPTRQSNAKQSCPSQETEVHFPALGR